MRRSGSGPALAETPSFGSYSSKRLADIAARVVNELKIDDEEERYDDDVFLHSSSSSSGLGPSSGGGCLKETETERRLDSVADGGYKEENQSAEVPKVDRLETNENGEQIEGDEENDELGEDDDGEFEFHVLCGGDNNSSPISADEIFSNGKIKPMFPIFDTDLVFGGSDAGARFMDGRNLEESRFPPPSPSPSRSPSSSPSGGGGTVRLPLRKLFVEERETASCSSSEADDLDGLAPESYCVWSPKERPQEMSKKSNSTGSGSSSSTSKRWRIRDLLNRSHSDGKDSFVFLTPNHHSQQHRQQQRMILNLKKGDNNNKSNKSKLVAAEKETKAGGGVKKVSMIEGGAGAAGNHSKGKVHEKHYLKNRAMREEDRKKSYLPYRQGLVGFFANVNGVNRTVQPF